MKSIKYISRIVTLVLIAKIVVSCSNYLETPSFAVITPEAVWKDPKLINGILVNLYDGMEEEPFNYWFRDSWRLMNPTSMSDEAQASYQKDPMWDNGNATYTYEDNLFDRFSEPYKAIYNCNNFLGQLTNSTLSPTEQKILEAEVRFIRAWHYFSLVKRYGGVPLIPEAQVYTGPENIPTLQVPRDKEYVIYDFIISEMQAIAGILPSTRSGANLYQVTSGAAQALCSRAALYAATIAKYGTLNNTVYPEYDWVVGIPPEMAGKYFQACYDASSAVITSTKYELGDYATMFTKTVNGNNGEYIFQRQYNVSGGRGHDWDKRNAPFSFRQGGWGCGMAPTLELVESYEYTDGSEGDLKLYEADDVTLRRFTDPLELFKDKDPRLFASVYMPGSPCKGDVVEMRRGIVDSNGNKQYASQQADVKQTYKDPVTDREYDVSGKDGFSYVGDQSKTGFYQKKYFDETLQNVDMGKSETPWCVFRLGEMYLNLAEAGVELGGSTNEQAALDAINTLRKRAGIVELGTIDLDKVRHERKVELTFEGHRFWDMKRWRIAHLDVSQGGLTNFRGAALCPWYHVSDGKYTFEIDPNTPKQTRIFLKKNYYTKISSSDINANPAMIQNPEYTN
jgi:hypothetical protein